MKRKTRKEEIAGLQERINPRTGRTEYRKEYRYKDSDGKWHHSKTGWCQDPDAVISEYHQRQAEGEEAVRTSEPTLLDLICQYDTWLETDDCTEHPGSIRTLLGVGHVHEKSLPAKIGRTRRSKIDENVIGTWAKFYCIQYKGKTGERLAPASFSNHKKFVRHFLTWLSLYTPWSDHDPMLVHRCGMILYDIKSPGATQSRKRKAEVIEEDEYWKVSELYQILNMLPYAPVPWLPVTGPETELTRGEDPELMPQPSLDGEGLRNAAEMIENGRPRREVVIYSVFSLLFYAGLRFEEARALTWTDVDFEGQTIDIHTAKNYRVSGSEKRIAEYRAAAGTTKNPSSNRMIVMLPPLYNCLMTYYYIYKEAYGTAEGLIFPPEKHSKDGMLPPSSVQNWIDKCASSAGVKKLSPHRFRHSCAMYLAWDLHLPIQRAYVYFGHTDEEMLRRVYAHFDKVMKMEQLKEDLEQYGAKESDWATVEEAKAKMKKLREILEEAGVDPDDLDTL